MSGKPEYVQPIQGIHDSEHGLLHLVFKVAPSKLEADLAPLFYVGMIRLDEPYATEEAAAEKVSELCALVALTAEVLQCPVISVESLLEPKG